MVGEVVRIVFALGFGWCFVVFVGVRGEFGGEIRLVTVVCFEFSLVVGE